MFHIFFYNAPIKIHLQNETAMLNVASEITNSNILEKLDKNSFSDPNNNYKIITDVHGKPNCKHMPCKWVNIK